MQLTNQSAPLIQTSSEPANPIVSKDSPEIQSVVNRSVSHDLRQAQTGHINPVKINTVEEAIELFNNEVVREHNLEAFSSMPIKAVLEPLKNYTPDEIKSFIDDFNNLRKVMDKAQSSGTAHLTAGSPGSGKSTHFAVLAEAQHVALLDFDRAALPGISLYQKMKGTKSTEKEAKAAYEKFRGASQTLHNCMVPYAISKKKDLALAITSTSPFFSKTVDFIQKQGYSNIILHHMTCADQVRIDSNNLRNTKGQYQCDSNDLIKKGKDFYKKTTEYLSMPNIRFWVRTSASEAPSLAAQSFHGQAVIFDQSALRNLLTTHQKASSESHQHLMSYFS